MKLPPLTSHRSTEQSDFPFQPRRKHSEDFFFPGSLLILIQSSSSTPLFTFLQHIQTASGCVKSNLGSTLAGLGLNSNPLCRGELCQMDASEDAEMPKMLFRWSVSHVH